MKIERETADAGTVSVRLSGEVTISELGSLKSELLETLQSGQPLSLNLRDVNELDFSSIQLLAAAQNSFQAQNVQFDIIDSPTQIWRTRATAAGFPLSFFRTNPIPCSAHEERP